MANTGARRVLLTVAPIGNEWSVLEGGAYRGLYKLKSQLWPQRRSAPASCAPGATRW